MRVARVGPATHTAPVSTETIDLQLEADHTLAIDRASNALRKGRPVVLPTETVYGIAANAADPEALDRLWAMKGRDRRATLAWHLHSPTALSDALLDASIELTPIHRRVIRVLTPGPVTLAVPAPPSHLAAVRERARVAPFVIDDGSELLARVPDRRITRDIIERAAVPIVIASIGETRLARTAGEAAAILAAVAAAPPALILDDGPASFARLSTLIRLAPDAGYHILREGAIDERTIRKRMARTLLFVCTGNTCRSPMAAAIARHLLAPSGAAGVETRVKSAGTSAGFGMEATPEGVAALRDLGIGMEHHASTPLSRELLNEAEVIYAMTRSHLDAILRLDPSAKGRVCLLDPEGRDIPDPISSPRAVYDETARMLRNAIEKRLAELPE